VKERIERKEIRGALALLDWLVGVLAKDEAMAMAAAPNGGRAQSRRPTYAPQSGLLPWKEMAELASV
jgi:hypothetical protein